ncbi:MAG: acyl-CoA dehydrogenase [Alphaproteobacteria bacterium]|nr:acyl-CoA dehydrogenase [Alphaproteobacteria bacterium]
MNIRSWRRDTISRAIFKWARGALPRLSDTEREALEAGDVWWDAELFTGDPDWSKLHAYPRPTLTEDERAFLDGPTHELCAMLDDWRTNWEQHDIPKEAWDFIRTNRFFGMIIPKEYGGLAFSAFAHSTVVRKISTRSLAAAVTVMVPNSLGPGELLLRFGTQQQRDYWLPRLADGREIPCFALTSPDAGSDASSMTDTGVICRGRYKDTEVLGIRLNWNKRYITLCPVATLLGVAFKLLDPDHLLGDREELGITLALVPTQTPGVEIGRRHIPAYQFFQNGPTVGRDVFIPLDNIIGGAEAAGAGWKMLMSALAAGRGISLPSLSAAGAAFAARTTGAYARIREQFDIPIGRFEGIQQSLCRIATAAYVLDSACRLTCTGIDLGHHAAVISAIMKSQATERMRATVNDAMDVHAGKAVIDGPSNYLGNLYRAVPVAITVEGANIMTRNLIIFGQGAIRCHPFLLDEIFSLTESDPAKALDKFDQAFWRHVSHSFKTAARAFGRAWFGGSPRVQAPRETKPFYKALNRYAAGFALTSDLALLTLGGSLKRHEMISARLGDIFSELYLLSAVLKRWEDEGRCADDLPIVEAALAYGFSAIESRFAEIFANFPNRAVATVARAFVLPFGRRQLGPSDLQKQSCANILLEPSNARDRLTEGLFLGNGQDSISRLEHAFVEVARLEGVWKRMHDGHTRDVRVAIERGLINEREAAEIQAMKEAVASVVSVDDFSKEQLQRRATPSN